MNILPPGRISSHRAASDLRLGPALLLLLTDFSNANAVKGEILVNMRNFFAKIAASQKITLDFLASGHYYMHVINSSA